MMETKLTRFRVNNSRETGEVTLLIETKCGFRPVMGWPDAGSLQEFAETLIGICSQINERSDGVSEAADRLLRQALNDEPETEQ